MNLPQLTSAFLYCIAGLMVFILLFNRALSYLPEIKNKVLILVLAFFLIVGGNAIFGLILYQFPWNLLPVGVFMIILLGEIHQTTIRQSHAGSPPGNPIRHFENISQPVTTTAITSHHFTIAHPKWHSPPLRIVHLSDLHVHPNHMFEYHQKVIELAEQAQADLAFFTGDFITNLASLPALQKILRPVARVGTFAVLGNHDYWAGADQVAKVIQQSGIELITNHSEMLTIGNQSIQLTGYDYPWGTSQKFIPYSINADLHLVLSHTPDNIYRIAQSAADIVFSGHFHAGQIRLPWLGAIVVPSFYGRRFDHGHFVIQNTHLFVTSGIGCARPALRIYCQPDFFVIDIVSNNEY